MNISITKRKDLAEDIEATLRDFFEEGKPTEWKFPQAATEIVENILTSLGVEASKTCDNCAFGELRKQPRGLVSSPPLQCAHCSANYE